MWRVLRGAQDPFVLVDAYFILPGNTSVFDPATAGLSSMPEPEFVEWRISNGGTAITNVVVGLNGSGNPIATVTSTGHGLLTGQQAQVYNVLGFDQFNSPNGAWTITKVDANNFTLNGCTAAGTYVSGGIVTGGSATDQFLPCLPMDFLQPIPTTSGVTSQTESAYAWEGGVFRFFPSSQARELRIVYRASGVAPSLIATTIPIDDSQDFLATRTAAIAAATRGAGDRAVELAIEALGPTRQADGSGGILGQLLRADIRNLQRKVYRRPAFRARRNRPDLLMY